MHKNGKRPSSACTVRTDFVFCRFAYFSSLDCYIAMPLSCLLKNVIIILENMKKINKGATTKLRHIYISE